MGKRYCFIVLAAALLFLFLVAPLTAANAAGLPVEEGEALGSSLPLWSIVPFIGILLSIAICPLVIPKIWHHHFGKISLFWALLFGVPFLFVYGGEAIHEILHTYLLEYIPFIILLWSLYTVAGGILIKGAPVGIPLNNLIILVIGTSLASWIGTTGAAMVLIRPYIRMNQFRKSKPHLVIFFIFLVANIGGSLTPLGDPPLFLGFLQGVDFFWTFNLFTEMLVLAAILFVIFFVFDTYMFRKEGWHERMHLKEMHFATPTGVDDIAFEDVVEEEDPQTHTMKRATYRMSIDGLHNLIFLAGVVGGVLFSGQADLGEVTVFGIHLRIENIVRDVALIVMGLLSLRFTSKVIREGNGFTWFPIQEVAKLFAGIFITIIPALAMLRAGEAGNLKFIIDFVERPADYFWITGTLSSFLDNAPTYLVFFNTALGKFVGEYAAGQGVEWLMTGGEIFLKAISTGAVFFGAVTYIGNAPNFMVKSISEENGIEMPSFFGFMLYSVVILVPLFAIITWIFF